LVASDGYRPLFQAWSCPVEVPYERAMADRESPFRTVYEVPVTGGAVGSTLADGERLGEFEGVALGVGDGDAVGANVPPGADGGELAVVVVAGVAHAVTANSSTRRSGARLGCRIRQFGW